jgi:cell division protein FtsN
MARSKVRKAGQRGGPAKKGNSMPGWVYMLAGLAIGLAVAYGVYVSGNKRLVTSQPEPVAEPAKAPAKKPATAKPAPAAVAEDVAAEGDITFDFYEMLPNLDVELYEETKTPTETAAPPAVSKQGIYIIQAGSFSGLADANRRKAELGLLGIHSEIKTGDAGGRTVYRVYTDPMENPDDVNRTSTLLTDQGIDILLKRVAD